MPTPNVILYSPAWNRLFSPVAPFTYRDGATYLEILEELSEYVKALGPNLNKILENFDLNIEETIKNLREWVQQENAESEARVQALIDDLMQRVNDAIDEVINTSIEVNDTIVRGIISNLNSESRKLLDELYSFPDLDASVRFLVTDFETGNIIAHKGDPRAITGDSIMSITKMIAALTAVSHGVNLGDLVTVKSSDGPGTSPVLLNNDIVSVRSLLYLSAHLSDNLATNVLARHVAETHLTVPDWSNPVQTFIRAMNAWLDDNGFTSAGAITTYSRSRLSMLQIDKLCREVQANSTLEPIFGSESMTINIQGANPRNVPLDNTINVSKNYMNYTRRGAAKTGRGNYDNFVMQCTGQSGRKYVITLLGATGFTERRYQQGGIVLDAVERGKTLRDYGNVLGSNSQFALENDTDTLDITGYFTGVKKLGQGMWEGVFMRRRGNLVEFTIQDCLVPFNVLQTAVIPPGFRSPLPFSAPLVAKRNAERMVRHDITDQAGATRNPDLPGSGIFLNLYDTSVEVVFRSVTLPEQYNHQLTSTEMDVDFTRLTPLYAAHDVLIDADGALGCFLGTNGWLFLQNRFANGPVNGTIRYGLRAGNTGYCAFDESGNVQIFGGDSVESNERLGLLYVSKFRTTWLVGSGNPFPSGKDRIGNNTVSF